MQRAFLFLGFCLMGVCLCAEEREFRFEGKHLIANYTKCDVERLQDVQGMMAVMEEAVRVCGATVLDKSYYVFPGNGLTMVILLSESHASIHTYPEHGACFIDLFTCGDRCDHAKFDAVLRAYLNPQAVVQEVLIRNDH